MQTAGSGPDSPSTAILATLPATTSGHPGNLGLTIYQSAVAKLSRSAETLLSTMRRNGHQEFRSVYAEVTQKLREKMQESYTVDNLKTVPRDEFRNQISSLIGKIDPDIEGYMDPEKQRDFSVKFYWGHNHDFGEFSINGSMGDRHIEIVAHFISTFGLPIDLTGKKILDIGVWTGGTSLLLSALGAEITAIEEVRKYANTVNYMAKAFGVETLKCEETSLYNLDFHDCFDYVIYSGVIYHVTDPIISLRILFNALNDGGEIFVETMGVNANNIPPVALVEGPAVVRSGSKENLSRSGWNYFVPSNGALKLWIETAGFENVAVSSLTPQNRILAKAVRRSHVDITRAGLSRPDIR